MFDRFIRILICLTALACPTTGGRCCGSVADSATIEADCDSGHCHDHATESHSDHVPCEQSESCRDCFCAGALPPDFQSIDVPSELALAMTVALASFDVAIVPSAYRSQMTEREKPPSGRALLTSYCILRL